MGMLSRFGLVRSSQVTALQEELASKIASLETKVRLLKANSSGVPFGWGQFEYEQTEQLQGATKWDTISDMENDPHVKGALDSNVLPLLSAQWKIEAASDKSKDKEIAEFCDANLLRGGGDQYGSEYWSATSWHAQRLPEILRMLPDGFAMFSDSTREVNGKWVFDRMQWLEPSSVDPRGWKLDVEDNIVEVKRTFRDPTDVYRLMEPLPLDAIALFVWDLRGARFEGRPFIRSMFGPWYRKAFLQRQSMMWAQKVGDPVPLVTYPPTNDPALATAADEFAGILRGTAPRTGYGVFPQTEDGKKVEAQYIGSDVGDIDRMRGLIDGENAEIAHGGQTKSQLLGETTSGARALAEPLGKHELQFVRTVAMIVCEWENHGVANLRGRVQKLIGWNFAGVKDPPQLVCTVDDPYENLGRVEATVKAKAAGLLPDHPDVRRAVAGWIGLSLPDDAYDIEETPVVPGVKVGPDGKPIPPVEEDENAPEEGEEEPPEEMAAAASLEAFKDRISRLLLPAQEGAPSGAGFRRLPNVLEAKYCNLAAISETFRVGERDAMIAMREIRYRMTEEILGRVRAGKFTPRNLDGQRRSKFRGYEKAKAMLGEVLRGVGEQGMAHVKDEIAKQVAR